MKIQEIKGQLYIIIPKEKAQRWGIQKDLEVNWDFNERGNLELTRIDRPLTNRNRVTGKDRKGDYSTNY